MWYTSYVWNNRVWRTSRPVPEIIIDFVVKQIETNIAIEVPHNLPVQAVEPSFDVEQVSESASQE